MTEYTLDTTGYGSNDPNQGSVSTSTSAEEQLLNANIGFNSTSIPGSVAAGQQFTVSTDFYLNCLATITPIASRVKFSIPKLSESHTVDTGKLGCGQSANASKQFTAPSSPNQSLQVNVEVQVNPPGPITGWTTRGKKQGTVSVVTKQQQQQQNITGYATWAAGGGAAGYLLGQTTGSISPKEGALVGAGAGALIKNQGGTNLVPSIPSIPTTKIAVLGGGALALAILLKTSGASGFLEPAGNTAGSVLKSARNAARPALNHAKKMAGSGSGS